MAFLSVIGLYSLKSYKGGAPTCAVTRIVLEPVVQVGLSVVHQAINISGDGSTALALNPEFVD